jgi:transcriptional regulator with XRE-family HTH domain
MNTPLQIVRRKHQKTLREVADAVSIDPGNLSRIERGVQTPSPELAESLSKYFANEVSEIEIFYPHRFMKVCA